MLLKFDSFALLAILLLSVAALVLLISRDWRLSIGALGIMYIGVFIMVLFSWSLEMAVVKLVAGWISASVLGIGLVSLGARMPRPGRYWPSEIIFRISAAGLVVLVTISLVPKMQELLPEINLAQAFASLLLVGLGMLHLGFTLQPLRTVLGVLTIFSGFEILYATIESSILVAGFLASINMGVALVGSYLLLVPILEDEE